MKKLLFIFLTTFAISCSSDDSSGTASNRNGLKLKSVEQTNYTSDENGNRIATYEEKAEYFYGSNGYANKVVTTHVYEAVASVYYEYFEYNGNTLKQREYSYKNHYNDDTETNSYSYKNNLIHTETTTVNKRYVRIRNFKYNSSKNLVYMESFNEEDKEIKVLGDFTYDTNDNIIKASFNTNFDYPGYTVSYQYDTKNNPLKNVFPKAYLKVIQVGENNIIKSEKMQVEYEYNEQGYPIKAVELDRTTTYEYY